MARASGTQEEQRSRIIRPADAQMFVLVAARLETDYGHGEPKKIKANGGSLYGESFSNEFAAKLAGERALRELLDILPTTQRT
jgi:hypothetical protein